MEQQLRNLSQKTFRNQQPDDLHEATKVYHQIACPTSQHQHTHVSQQAGKKLKKWGADGQVQHFKARLVAKGFQQKYGEDFDEVFAPVVKYSTIRTLLSIAASKQMLVKHLDAKTALLHGNIEEELYMEQPPGFINTKHQELVCKLQKGLYGLKQSVRAWGTQLSGLLLQQEFQQGCADQSEWYFFHTFYAMWMI
ncbi:hypothetical protein JRQ81_016762 [Phrynocephalus forsythii]|uniref:Reverse transcriptase Ty1/copia-type domain-containing protein n=1 Tax=Phrynocephalus forsythii TaxID=171643 RepID=A0A9Q0XTT1_9SAUR|nr:hypothetical protein JRQ81_016762 [Phrynocephalus forsythii]